MICRRWPSKHELVRAASGHSGAKDRPPAPDTGSLRGDLIALLRRGGETRVGLAVFLSVQLAAYYRETGTSIADLREVMLGSQSTGVDTIMARGIARGEIDPAKLTPRIAALPFDLFRLHVLMNHKPLPEGAIEEIVSTIFLPLVTPEGDG